MSNTLNNGPTQTACVKSYGRRGPREVWWSNAAPNGNGDKQAHSLQVKRKARSKAAGSMGSIGWMVLGVEPHTASGAPEDDQPQPAGQTLGQTDALGAFLRRADARRPCLIAKRILYEAVTRTTRFDAASPQDRMFVIAGLVPAAPGQWADTFNVGRARLGRPRPAV